MLVSDQIEITWNKSTRKHFESKGYIFTEYNDKFIVKIKDLLPKSEIKIQVLCDYCLEEGKQNIIIKYYKDYKRQKEDCVIKKDCCFKCSSKKTKESNLLNYGVENTSQLKEVQEKRENTMMERYGVKFALQNKDIFEKTKQTNLERYGVEFLTQTDKFQQKRRKYYNEHKEEILHKTKKTNLEKYGVEHPCQTEEIKNKIKQTNIEKYGVEHYLKTEEGIEKIRNTCQEKYGTNWAIKSPEIYQKAKSTNEIKYGVENPMQNEEIQIKQMQSMFQNGNVRSSKQQRYICELINGEPNYFIEKSFVDIAFPEEKIYCEYDGSGHELAIIHNQKTEHEFKEREKRRSYALIKSGWKEIRIISLKDYLPTDDKILEIFNKAKELFKEGFHRVLFNIDKKSIKTSKWEKDYDFGKLRSVRYVDI